MSMAALQRADGERGGAVAEAQAVRAQPRPRRVCGSGAADGGCGREVPRVPAGAPQVLETLQLKRVLAAGPSRLPDAALGAALQRQAYARVHPRRPEAFPSAMAVNARPHGAALAQLSVLSGARAAAAAGLGPEPLQLSGGGWLRSLGLVGGGLAGAKAGAALGSWLGPYGAIGGGILGGLGGSLLGYGAAGNAAGLVQVGEMERELQGIRARVRPSTAPRQAWSDARLAELDALEHRAYAWLDENRMVPGAAPLRRRVAAVMDGVQGEHAHAVGEVHAHNLTLWTPDRATLGPLARTELDTAWDQLRNGNGRVRVPGGPGGGNAGDELRAMHARLLSRPGGRRLLATLLDLRGPARGKNVDINFTPPDLRTPLELQQLKQERARVASLTRQMAQLDEDSDAYSELYYQRAQAALRIRELQGSDTAASAAAVNVHAASIGGTGAGSDSTVAVREGTRDSTDTVRDWWGNPAPAPAFVQYGHELIHALHNRDATESTGVDFGRYQGGMWTSREEHQTIESLTPGALSENLLREEHGITRRYGHRT